jgi:hypothetical protein
MERRTDAVELLDGPLDDSVTLTANLRDLRRVNRWLGGVRLSADEINALAAHRQELDTARCRDGRAEIPLALRDHEPIHAVRRADVGPAGVPCGRDGRPVACGRAHARSESANPRRRSPTGGSSSPAICASRSRARLGRGRARLPPPRALKSTGFAGGPLRPIRACARLWRSRAGVAQPTERLLRKQAVGGLSRLANTISF